MSQRLHSQVPSGPLETKWEKHKFEMKLVNPANRRKFEIIVVGTGLAGASAAASLGELGYQVKAFCVHESPRRAHSVAAQGGINAAKNYKNDGDSVYRLFYDTIKGGDFRAREANVYRLAEISTAIIDHCVAIGVPFAREYGGLLANRSFGGAQVSRTFYARGQTGQQLLLGAYQSLMRQVDRGQVQLLTRREMLDLVVINGRARGIIVRNLLTGELERYSADAVILATGGYSNVFFLSTNAMACAVTAAWRAFKRGAFFANPCFTQIHPTCIPVHGENQSKLTLMSESLRNDGRVWVPLKKGDTRHPNDIPENERDYYLERIYPSFGNLAPRDVASRQAKYRYDEGRGVGGKEAVYLDFRDAIKRLGKAVIAERYGNLFEMYEKITGENPYEVPMRIYPAPHYTMGGLWVDYHLMSTIPGLFVAGEANFSDHGANRLGASALMQGLADGFFILPYTVGNFLANVGFNDKVSVEHDAFREAEDRTRQELKRLISIKGNTSVDAIHKKLGRLMWDYCGMSRNREGLKKAIEGVRQLRELFWNEVYVPGELNEINPELEKAARVADFLELGELMCWDALEREESCGGHFREEHQTADGEAKRNDERFCHVAAWEYRGPVEKPVRHQEELVFENVKLTTRSYK
ncbi:MAG: fumarate reductase/succinate dehydrogenase flavoprotein subunit [Bdellovibrionaceae bacterium]|nr:fumarate reductase/succinate dehydrogenase flavoprotein subunit [Pseudobdellovibrionaceae bacterium]MDW8190263.1 fumarate reductase/succinate dehydrogenase flavoprotein subunit [Pseudobdellovibrionaceae bacterium]